MRPLIPSLALVLAVVVGGPACSAGGPSAATPTADSAPTVRAAFFALSVADLDRQTKWYEEHLGFRVELRRAGGEGGPAAVLLARDGALLELLALPGARPPAEGETLRGILKIGFVVADLDALFAAAKQRQLDVFFPIVAPEGNRYRTFGLRDPEGNIVQLFGE